MMGSNPTIVISNARIARELIDKKSSSVSDRPPNHMVDIVTDGKYLTFARYCTLMLIYLYVFASFFADEWRISA